MPATYDPIATTTLGSAASAITFNSIGSGYTDLRIVLLVTSTSLDQRTPRLTFNNDTTTNYSFTYLNGDGTSVVSSTSSSVANINLAYHGTSLTIPVFYTIDLFNYAGSTNKAVLAVGSEDKNGSGSTHRLVGTWRDNTAITRIDLTSNTGTFSTGTTATLYGILKA